MADLSRAPIFTRPNAIVEGSYYTVKFDIILLFGTTELQAQLAWTENVSCLHMFDPIDIGLILRRFLGNRETVSFEREIASYLDAQTHHIFIFLQECS